MSGFFGSLFGSAAATNKATLSAGATAGTNSKSMTNLEKGPKNAAVVSPYNARVNVAPPQIEVVTRGGKRRHQSRKQNKKQKQSRKQSRKQ